MADVPGLSGPSSSSPSAPRGSDSVRLTVPAVDDRGARTGQTGAGRDPAVAPSRDQPPHVIRFEGRDLDPYAPRGTYLDITV